MTATRVAAVLLLTFVPGVDRPAQACTTFCMRADDTVLFGRNYDFEIGDGLVLVNRRGTERVGARDGGTQWTSRYGSVTFNQFGRDFPTGGMNETGLVVELMWLDGTRYPDADDRRELGVLEWIQYQLDTARSVEEVIASDAAVRIEGATPLHYLVSDANGHAAAIEFLDGRLVAHTADRLPVPVLTNSTYEASLRHLRAGPASTGSSLDRFATAAKLLAEPPPPGRDPVDRAFDVLRRVAQRSTRWSIVYDEAARIVYFRTDRHASTRSIRLAGLDFSCAAPVRMLDVHAPVEGDVTSRLEPYTREANRDLVRRSYRGTSFLRGVPDATLDAIASHPDATRCERGPTPAAAP